jgi:hypothetical protein
LEKFSYSTYSYFELNFECGLLVYAQFFYGKNYAFFRFNQK